jgi:hypothetical protein
MAPFLLLVWVVLGAVFVAVAAALGGWIWVTVPVAALALAYGYRWAFRLVAHRDPPGWTR